MGDNRFHPCLEGLECRLNPAICSVQFFSNLLIINGSGLADNITVSQPSPGRITLTGVGTTTFSFAGRVQSSVTIGSAVIPVKSLTAYMNTGSDSFQFNQSSPITLAGSVKVDLGTGNDALGQFGTQNLKIGGSLTVLHGTGNANIHLADFTVAGSASISLGSGPLSFVTIDAATGAPNNNIGGMLTINAATGDKEIVINTTNVTGLTNIIGGSNNAGTTNVNLVIDELSNGSALVNLKGGFIYSESATNLGHDTIGLFDGTTVGSSVRITTFGPGAWIGFEGVTIAGATTINELGASGINTLAFTADYHNSFFGGLVNIRMGNGDDSIAFDVDAATVETFNGAISATLGTGNDTVTVGGGGTNLNFKMGGLIDGGLGFDTFFCAEHTGVLEFINWELPPSSPVVFC